MIIATASPPPVPFSPLRLQAARLEIIPCTAAVAKGLTEICAIACRDRTMQPGPLNLVAHQTTFKISLRGHDMAIGSYMSCDRDGIASERPELEDDYADLAWTLCIPSTRSIHLPHHPVWYQTVDDLWAIRCTFAHRWSDNKERRRLSIRSRARLLFISYSINMNILADNRSCSVL